MGARKPDFGGWATKYNILCTDGRTIRPDAFEHMDKKTVQLVWQHQHNSPENILGHATLEHRAGEGVYAYGYFNGTPPAAHAKALVDHEDVSALSIYAINLQEQAKQVRHGDLHEVSLVMKGANSEAVIDDLYIRHSDGRSEQLDGEALIYSGLENDVHAISHADGDTESSDEESFADIIAGMDEKEQNVLYTLVAAAAGGGSAEHSATVEDPKDDPNAEVVTTDPTADPEPTVVTTDPEDPSATTVTTDSTASTDPTTTSDDTVQHSQEDSPMTRNLFDQSVGSTLEHSAAAGGQPRKHLTHAQITTIFKDADQLGSLKASVLAHAVEYGIENIDLLFPDAKAVASAPELISRRMEWVAKVIDGARKTPFSRIKSLAADITHDEARAKGYVKGNFKKEEWFGLTKRITTPTTIYKKQKLDRDDILDITELDVVAWLKGEMRIMLEEECARAILIGDGREVDDEDKVREPIAGTDGAGIRSIAHDDDFYAHKVVVPAGVSGDVLVETILRSRKNYKGAGNPTMFTTEDLLTDLILLKDKMGRRQYDTQAALEAALRVSNIVTVPVMEDESVNGGDLLAIFVNMNDYTVGTDRGGQVTMFDDFDIDYNQYKYLMETRFTGALTKHKTAIVLVRGGGTLRTPVAPTFDTATDTVTIPTVAGVSYRNSETDAVVTGSFVITEQTEIVALPESGSYFPYNTDTDWVFDPAV